MRGLLFALFIISTPAFAEDDFFSTLSGSYGVPFNKELSCESNPHHVTFFDGNRRVRFEWQNEIRAYDGTMDKFAEYDVAGANGLGIIMALDGESRVTDAGQSVVWVMRPVKGFDGYCWGRTDWPDARCIAPHIRCPEVQPTS